MHLVDEDLMVILSHGGRWLDSTQVGIAFREMKYDWTSMYDYVASSNMKNSQIIRILMMSTKI